MTMLLIRPVETSDVEDISRLASLAGAGMTSLPQDRAALERNIESAVSSFSREHSDPADYFLMVLEDPDKKQVVGTAAVYARTGFRQAFYAYRLMSVTHYSHSLDHEIRSSLLHLTNDYTDFSELGTLFLDPEYRGNGHWLSRSRYMLLGLFADRFSDNVIAELRGWLDESGNSPFWEAIGAKFFSMPYSEADRLSGVGSNQFITELMPKYPIYSNLLPESAIEVMGVPHASTQRAMDLLIDEGFEYENMIDIFDGGPMVRAKLSRIRSVERLRRLPCEIDDQVSGDECLLSNTGLKDLRVVHRTAQVEPSAIKISATTARMLGVENGGEIAIID